MNRYYAPRERRINSEWRKAIIKNQKKQVREARLDAIANVIVPAVGVAVAMFLMWAFTCLMLTACPNVASSGF